MLYFLRDTYNIPEDGKEMREAMIALCLTTGVGAMLSPPLANCAFKRLGLRPRSAAIIGMVGIAFAWILAMLLRMNNASLFVLTFLGASLYGFWKGFFLAGDQAITWTLVPDKNRSGYFLGLQSISAFAG